MRQIDDVQQSKNDRQPKSNERNDQPKYDAVNSQRYYRLIHVILSVGARIVTLSLIDYSKNARLFFASMVAKNRPTEAIDSKIRHLIQK